MAIHHTGSTLPHFLAYTLAPAMGEYRAALRRQGFGRLEALTLCVAYQRELVSGGGGGSSASTGPSR